MTKALKELADQYNELFASLSPQQILQRVVEVHSAKAVFSTSLGVEDQAITHILMQISRDVSIFTLDTGRMFPETYEVLEKTEARYGIRIKVVFPDYKAVEHMVQTRGINLFYYSIENRKMCCHIRKIEPLKRALKNQEVWITGLRREQSPTRQDLHYAQLDEENQVIKVNPLLDWSDQQVWNFVRDNDIPFNTLHQKGFPSIGCQPCTRAIEPGEDLRAGRWWWENPETKECGLHKRGKHD